MRRSILHAGALLAGVALTGCGEGAPMLRILSPTSGQQVTLGRDAARSVPISFQLSGFTLAPEGGCATPRCGHLHVQIDGDLCDGAASEFNSVATTSPALAAFGSCMWPYGGHTVSLLLHDDRHELVQGEDGNPVLASVAITTQD